jgi:hypothetical protein
VSRCSICSSARDEAIDAALARSALRAVAREFGVPRSTLQRHAAHAGVVGPTGPVGGREHLGEALALLAEARTEREALSALASVRASLRLELKDFRAARPRLRPPDARHLEALRDSLERSWAAFERVRSRNDLAARALSGVRQALDSLREAEARLPEPPEELVTVRIRVTPEFALETEWPSSVAAQIPPEGLSIRWPAPWPTKELSPDPPGPGNGNGPLGP